MFFGAIDVERPGNSGRFFVRKIWRRQIFVVTLQPQSFTKPCKLWKSKN